MSPKYFENTMEDYGTIKSKEYLNSREENLSDLFREKIQVFVNSKIPFILRERREIFSSGCVYTGSAGIGLLLYLRTKHALQGREDALLEALQYVEGATGSRAPSFLCGVAGPLALGAVISFHLRRPYAPYVTKLEGLLEMAESRSTPDELLYGRVGYLYALLFVNRETGQNIISEEIILQVGRSVIQSGQQLAAQEGTGAICPLQYRWHDSNYYGAAHGMAGILLLLLQGGVRAAALKPTLDWLLDQCYPSGNLPSSQGSSSDRLVQWCHGAPGFVQPLLLAHQITKEPKYLECALRCGEVVWKRGLCTKGYSLCHGVAGNGYTFLQLYQGTGDPRWLYRAGRFAEWCIDERPGTEEHTPDRPFSLFEGLAGRLYFLTDILYPLEAKFPGYSV